MSEAASFTSAAGRGAAIAVESVTKQFGAKKALNRVSLDVPAGSFCVLLGPSGSGKTTLLRCLAGIERLTSGRITLGGRLVADGAAHRPPEQRDLAMVFQDYALWPHLTAARNVEFALGRRPMSRGRKGQEARRMLHRVGLGHLADRYPNELSGGEQQRVALARALVGSTSVLLFDEPLSNLDADLRERMRIEISTLARESGATSVYITHDQSEAFALADRIGVLSNGELIQLAAPETVYHHPANPFVARFTGLAGELDVVIDGHLDPAPGGRPRLSVRPRHLPGPAAPIVTYAPGGPPPSRDATVMVRPSAARLAAPGDPDRHLDAMVLDTAYRGRGYDHALQLADGTQLIGVHDERRWERGDHVAVKLATAGCLLFGRTSVDAAPSGHRPAPADQPVAAGS